MNTTRLVLPFVILLFDSSSSMSFPVVFISLVSVFGSIIVVIFKYFDKEVVEDVMNTMYGMGVDMKTYRTWSKLNSKTKIRVKTGVGYTEWANERAMIGQGTGGGALVSQANLDKGMTEMFTGSEEEIGYGSVRMIPLMF